MGFWGLGISHLGIGPLNLQGIGIGLACRIFSVLGLRGVPYLRLSEKSPATFLLDPSVRMTRAGEV